MGAKLGAHDAAMNGECPQMALSDTKIRTLKPKAKAYKLADEKGLFLLITPKNSKYWRFKFRFEGKEKNSLWSLS